MLLVALVWSTESNNRKNRAVVSMEGSSSRNEVQAGNRKYLLGI